MTKTWPRSDCWGDQGWDLKTKVPVDHSYELNAFDGVEEAKTGGKNEREPWLGRNGFVYNLQGPHLSEKGLTFCRQA